MSRFLALVVILVFWIAIRASEWADWRDLERPAGVMLLATQSAIGHAAEGHVANWVSVLHSSFGGRTERRRLEIYSFRYCPLADQWRSPRVVRLGRESLDIDQSEDQVLDECGRAPHVLPPHGEEPIVRYVRWSDKGRGSVNNLGAFYEEPRAFQVGQGGYRCIGATSSRPSRPESDPARSVGGRREVPDHHREAMIVDRA